MILQSKYAGYVVHLKDPVFYTHQDTGFREQTRPSLVADFQDPSSVGVMGVGMDGESYPAPRGGTFDTDEAAERLGWTEEEKAYAEQKLGAMARNPREADVWLWEEPAPEAPIPGWDKLSPTRVLAISAELGVVREALLYERATANRPELVEMLERKQAAVEERASLEEALTA